MFKRFHSSFIFLFVLVIALTVAATASAKPKGGDQVSVVGIESLGVVTFPTGTMFDDTEVGGLSGLAYDASRGVYYVLSDDRGGFPSGDPRYYDVTIDLSDGSLDDGDVVFEKVTFLTQRNGDSYEPGSLDPEGMDMPVPGYNYISSEGDADATPPIDPFVDRFNPVGKQTRALPIPDKFLPDGTGDHGIRDNLAFEALTSTPNRRYLVTATENALEQDGPASTLEGGSPSRLLVFDLNRKVPVAEFVYCVAPIPVPPDPPGAFADNGLPALQALDNVGTFLAMERSFAVGVGNTIILYETSTEGATDVSGDAALGLFPDEPTADCSNDEYTLMRKEKVADLEDLGIDPDNMEGMVFGPDLPDGRRLLILVSDNNFSTSQITQFVALAVELE